MDIPLQHTDQNSNINLTDEQIVALVQGGDKEKFGVLMERYSKKLSRYGKKFLSNQDNIEDIVQDIFIKTYQNIQSFDTSLKFSSWIYRIAHNAFVNGLKKKQKSAMPYFDLDILIPYGFHENPVLEEHEREQMKKMIEIGLNELKPKYKEAIILHYLEEFSYKEISDILEVPIGTVGIRIMRGREALRKVYEDKNIKYEN